MLYANSYSGDITVPERFTDEGVEYTVTAFADKCFSGCSKLTSITIPSSVTSLGSSCFSDCSNLTSITIPSSVTSLGNYCFANCHRLSNITIPSSVTSLGFGSFSDCSSLTSVTIPSSVKWLNSGCFKDCNNIISITCKSPNPPSWNYGMDGGAFNNNTFLVSTLYVPDVEAYKNAKGWKNFKYIKKITSGGDDKPAEQWSNRRLAMQTDN